MLVYSNPNYVPKRAGGHGYEHHTRDAICGNCGKVIGRQVCYNDNKEFYFENREKSEYKFCPYCKGDLYETK